MVEHKKTPIRIPIPNDIVEAYEKRVGFHVARRLVQQYGNHEILNEGDPSCHHRIVYYIDNKFDRQAWWCDACSRHERLGYTPGKIMRFPPNSYLRTPNPEYGAESVYAWKTDKDGNVEELPFNKRRVRLDIFFENLQKQLQ